VAALPTTIPAPVVVVLHIPRHAPSALAAILRRSGSLPSSTALHGTSLLDGHLYVAPADRHLLVGEGCLLLSSEPPEKGHRPAIDPLLRSAARVYGSRAIGIVLSGTGNDGTIGLAAIAARGGAVLVQDPVEALYPAMPRNALHQVFGAVALPVAGLVIEICRLLDPARGRSSPGTREG
jgi:two-component system chemotaxis response regulator CheB